MHTTNDQVSYQGEYYVGDAETKTRQELGLEYLKIIEDKVRENGDFMFMDIEEVPNEFESVLKEFISPGVQVYGITGSLSSGSYSIGVSIDQSGDWGIVYGGELPVKAGLPLDITAMFFYSESYDATIYQQATGETLNVANLDLAYVLAWGKSHSKSLPDANGNQTTWETDRIGFGYGLDIGASLSSFGIINADEIDKAFDNRMNRLKNIR